MEKGLSWLKTQKFIEIGVVKFNSQTIDYYKKLGFEFTGEKEDLKIGSFIGKEWILKMKLRNKSE